MKIKNIVLSLGLLLCVFASMAQKPTVMSSQGKDVKKGVVRVKFSDDMIGNFQNFTLKSVGEEEPVYRTGVNQVDDTNSDINVFTFKRVFPYSPKHEAKHRKHGLHKWYELTFDSEESVEKVLNKYSTISGVEYVKPVLNKVHQAANSKGIRVNSVSAAKQTESSTDTDYEYPFDDPRLPEQWHYENFGDVTGEADNDIDLFSAWTKEAGNDSVIVAVVDEGVDFKHEDLIDAMWHNEAELNGKSGVDDDGNGYIDDVYGYNFVGGVGTIAPGDHGTHVAGTVAAVNNNGIGVSGVAGGSDGKGGVRIMGCQIYASSGASGGTPQAYIYAADNGANIAQSSWSYSQVGDYEPELLEALDYFVEEAGDYEGSKMKGGVIFFSAGNNSSYGNFYPATYEKVIGVTSTGSYGTPASYTNYHETFDIAAPGGNYEESNNYSGAGVVLSCLKDNGYGFMQGTSMACPHASGVAALIASYSTDEDFTAADLTEKILNFAAPFSSSKIYGSYEGNMGVGNLNALNVLLENEGKAPEIVEYFITRDESHDRVTFEWIVPADEDDVNPTGFDLALGTEPFDTKDFDKQELFSVSDAYTVGDTVDATLSGLYHNTTYYISIRAKDLWDNIGPAMEPVAFRTLDLPAFSISENKILLQIDASKNPVETYEIELKNDGEGAVVWSSDVANRDFLWPDNIDSVKWDFKEEETDAAVANVLAAATINNKIGDTDVHRDYNDQTIYTSGLYNDPDTSPEAYYGNMNHDHRFTYAVRFAVPVEYYFNMTHIAAWMQISNDEDPIRVEVRNGKELTESEIVSQRFYTPDTTGIYEYRIPLDRSIEFTEGEYFWVVMSHPKNEDSPIISNYSYQGYGINLVSLDSGISWKDFAALTADNPQVIKLRAYSVGSDPSYTYIDPIEGEIGKFDVQKTQIVVNAEHLRNGDHTSFVSLYTNDPNYPAGSIDVNVLVTGQVGELTYELETPYNNLVVGKENEITFNVKNEGFGDAVITDVVFDSGDWTYSIDEDVIVYAGGSIDLELTHVPSVEGHARYNGTVITEDKEYDFYFDVYSQDPSSSKLTLGEVTSFTVDKNETAEAAFSLQNTSADKFLEYDVLSEFFPDGEHAVSSITDYEVEYSVDASRWEDISSFGTENVYSLLEQIDLGFNFPFYGRTYSKVALSLYGTIVFGDVSVLPVQTDFPDENGYLASISVAKDQWTSGNLTVPIYMYYHSFGDHFVYSFQDMRIIAPSGEDDSEEENEKYLDQTGADFQIAVYNDGAIEYRYKNISGAVLDSTCIGMQDEKGQLYELMKSYESTTLNSDGFDVYENEVPTQLEEGAVIRLTPNSSPNFLSVLSHDNGRLAPNESVDFTVLLDESLENLNEGSYKNTVTIETNTLSGAESFELELNVNGRIDSVLIDTTEVYFGRVYTELSYTDTLVISNYGSKENAFVEGGFVTNIEGVTLEGIDTPINPGEHRRVLVKYAPQTRQTLSDILTIKTEAEDFDVTLHADSYVSPTYSIPNKALAFDLTNRETQSGQFVINNTSNDSELFYQVYSEGPIVLDQNFVTETSSTLKSVTAVTTEEDDDEKWKRLPYEGTLDSCYRYVSSFTEGVDYFYEDILYSGEQLIFGKNEYQSIELGHEFPFFGKNYSTIWVNENGYVTVVAPMLSNDPFFIEFKEDDDVSGMIVPMWSDWNVNEYSNGQCYVETREDVTIIQWRNVQTLHDYATGVVSFEVMLFNDGRIKFLYDSIQDFDGSFNIGIESPDEKYVIDLGEPGEDLQYFGMYPDKSSIQIAPAVYGSIQPGESETIDFTASPAFLSGGNYTNSVFVHTNSSEALISEISVETVVGDMVGAKSSSIVDFGSHYFIENEVHNQTFYLQNSGSQPIQIERLKVEDVANGELYFNGEAVSRSYSGYLVDPIDILPGNAVQIALETFVDELGTFEGSVTVGFDNSAIAEKVIPTHLEVLSAPSFESTQEDLALTQLQSEDKDFSFKVSNTGDSEIVFDSYALFNNKEFSKEDLVTPPSAVFDSLQLFETLAPSSYLGGSLSFPMTAAVIIDGNGMDLTHVRAFLNIQNTEIYTLQVRIAEWTLDSYPNKIKNDSLGVEIYSSLYTLNGDLGAHFRYFTIPDGIVLEEGKQYMLSIEIPDHEDESQGVIGLEICHDEDVLEREYFQSGVPFTLGWNHKEEGLEVAYWIGAVSGATSEGFVSLSTTSDTLQVGEFKEIKATISGADLSTGMNEATIVTRVQGFPIQKQSSLVVTANTKPLFIATPTSDTLVVEEKTPFNGSYLVRDEEGEKVNLTLVDNDGLNVVFTQQDDLESGEAYAKIYFNTGWEDEGLYDVVVRADDEIGNSAFDTLQVEITNLNRTPLFILDEPIVTNLANGTAWEIDMNDAFEDPDGDELTFTVGNGNPELYTTTLVDNHLLVTPIQEGIGVIAMYADDGQETIGYYYYVYVLDDPNYNNSPSGIGNDLLSGQDANTIMTFPNPVVDESNVCFKLEETAEVRIDLLDMNGRLVRVVENGTRVEGNNTIRTDLSDLIPGNYFYRLVVNGELKSTIKVLKK